MSDFIANQDFINYLLILGYKSRPVNSKKKYYSDKLGNQIKIDKRKKRITLMDKFGYCVYQSISISEKKLKYFTKHGNLNNYE